MSLGPHGKWFLLAAICDIAIRLGAGHAAAQTGGSQAEAQQPAAHHFCITYHLASGSEKWDPAVRKRITDAMDAAIVLYNEEGEFNKTITANYSPKTRTADGGFSGWINLGHSISKRVALHEIAHTLGVGTHWKWSKLVKDHKWTGEHALAQLREFDGPNAVLHADRMHFWPYGLNYDREGGPENFRRHVKMVAAMRLDMGIVNGR